jgi:NitT/TauT family transport system substrate-binding protein
VLLRPKKWCVWAILKFAHYGAVSYIKEIAPKCGIKVEERVFAKGLDAMQAVIAGELDVGGIF